MWVHRKIENTHAMLLVSSKCGMDEFIQYLTIAPPPSFLKISFRFQCFIYIQGANDSILNRDGLTCYEGSSLDNIA
jgi:hypothetical protein